MNKQQLEAILKEEGFHLDAYDLEGGLLPEKYTLVNERGGWAVYYSERGLQTGKRHFDTESEACEYFLAQMRGDPTTRY